MRKERLIRALLGLAIALSSFVAVVNGAVWLVREDRYRNAVMVGALVLNAVVGLVAARYALRHWRRRSHPSGVHG